MNRAGSTAREALIAELLGDVAQLLERLDALAPAMADAHRSLLNAMERLTGQVHDFETRMTMITHNAKVQAVNHIVRRTAEVAGRSADAQQKAMEEAARALFNVQVEPALQRLAQSLRDLLERTERPWVLWATHVATALTASSITWLLVAWLRTS